MPHARDFPCRTVVSAAPRGQSGAMTLLLQALPLIALVVLLGSGRASTIGACAAALALSLPAAWLAAPGGAPALPFLAAFALRSLADGLWLAAIPVGIILGGLVFHEAVGGGGEGAVRERPVDVLFTGAFLLGGFTETVTGFGVGSIFALAAFRRVGVAGTAAASMALYSQMLIPWGGLGPGTAVGAALAGVPAQALATHDALILAVELPLLLPLFWRLCRLAGHPVPARTRLAQFAWVAAEAAILNLAHRLVTWEVCGLLATGSVLSVRLLLAAPPRTAADRRAAATAAAPYLVLAGALLASRA
jgi:lactate permease